MYLLGDVREEMAKGCLDYVEDFYNGMQHIKEPFYIVYYADVDHINPNRIIQTVKAYHKKPPFILGLLVWYVDNAKGIFMFRADLSSPPDVPLNPATLSDRKEDQITSIMEKGTKLPVIMS